MQIISGAINFLSRPAVMALVLSYSMTQLSFADSMYLTNGGQAYSFVSEFTTSGTYVGQFVNSLNNPAGIAQDNAGNFYVVNNGNNTVVKFQPDGTPVSPNPFISTNLSGAQTIALDQYGNYYVSEGGGTVEKFNSAGVWQMQFPASGAGYSIANAQGLWVDAQNTLYIADSSGNNQVVMLNSANGAYVNKINTNLSLPHGVIRDASGYLYVSNASANNVAKFNPDYSFNSLITGGMSFPIGLGLDATGNLFVANNQNNTITKYDSSGTLTMTINSVDNSIAGARWIAFKPYAVPEPSTYAMALAGLACSGYSLWRRRKWAAGAMRMSRFISRGACLAALMFTAAVPAQAGIIYGSGTAGPNTRDSHWKVLISSTATSPPGGQSYPYDAYAYGVVPTNWNGTGGFGVNQVGYTNADGTFYWIGPNSSADSALPFPQQYGYIIGQSFIAEQAGTYNFSIPANGDNFFSFFINGSISTADPNKPTITGGTQIGATSGDFQNIKVLTGSAYLNAGQNWAYAVIDEQGFSTGVLVAQSTFAAVPEPATYAMALAGLACGGYSLFRRRKRA